MKKLLADLVKVDAFLTAVSLAWAVVAANLSQIGVPLKVVSMAGALLALAVFLLGKGITATGAPAAPATEAPAPASKLVYTLVTPTPTQAAAVAPLPPPPPAVIAGGAASS